MNGTAHGSDFRYGTVQTRFWAYLNNEYKNVQAFHIC